MAELCCRYRGRLFRSLADAAFEESDIIGYEHLGSVCYVLTYEEYVLYYGYRWDSVSVQTVQGLPDAICMLWVHRALIRTTDPNVSYRSEL